MGEEVSCPAPRVRAEHAHPARWRHALSRSAIGAKRAPPSLVARVLCYAAIHCVRAIMCCVLSCAKRAIVLSWRAHGEQTRYTSSPSVAGSPTCSPPPARFVSARLKPQVASDFAIQCCRDVQTRLLQHCSGRGVNPRDADRLHAFFGYEAGKAYIFYIFAEMLPPALSYCDTTRTLHSTSRAQYSAEQV